MHCCAAVPTACNIRRSLLHSCMCMVTQGRRDQCHRHPAVPAHDAGCSAEAATAATAVLAAAAATLEAERRSAGAAPTTPAAAAADEKATSAEATPDSKGQAVQSTSCHDDNLKHTNTRGLCSYCSVCACTNTCLLAAQDFHTPAQSLHQSTSEHSMASAADTLDGNSGAGTGAATHGTTAEHPVRVLSKHHLTLELISCPESTAEC